MIPELIVMHHSATMDGRTFSWPAIRRYHTSYRADGMIIDPAAVQDLVMQGVPVQKPWADIGYHFGIERVGDGYEVLCGRMINIPGAHCCAESVNRRSVGICLVGDFDRSFVPPKQWHLALHLVRALAEVLHISSAGVIGHREAMPGRSCPGRHFDLDLFRRQL